jgi:methylated-DNA-[protein]-cysteine S-methyltransferase
MSSTLTHDTPIGPLALSASDAGLTRARFGPAATSGPPSPWLDQARRELDEYFAGTRTRFAVPLDLDRIDGERRTIMAALAGVGYGTTTTYGALAAAVGLAGDGARRVGVVMARNPLPVFLGCHRVLGADGRLTGYAGGLPVKRALLDLEGAATQLAMDLPAA